MKITVLMEDTCGNIACEYEHGLSLYIETEKHKILADTGKSEKTIKNADKLGIDLSMVDTVFLSHGHYDHAGGILPLQKFNNAMIYMQKSALGAYYHGEKYIGIDQAIADLPNIRLLDGNLEIDNELSIFSNITGRKYWPASNRILSVKEKNQNRQDKFLHEQCLVIHVNTTFHASIQDDGESQKILISGCAHNGILNILDRYHEIYGGEPDVVISGFHMMKKEEYSTDEIDMIKNTARELNQYQTRFYTGHCTGQKAFDIMKPIMGDKLNAIHCGMEIETGFH